MRELYSPRSPEFQSNPHPNFHELRSLDPVHWQAASGYWILTRFADVTAFLKDERFGKGTMFRTGGHDDDRLSPMDAMRRDWMLLKDPPEHTRLRALVSRAFTPRVVALLANNIQAITDALLDDAMQKPSFDAIGALAYPLPVTVIAILLGVPVEDRDVFLQFSQQFASVLEVNKSADDLARGNQLAEAMGDYFRRLIAHKRRHPQEDLISRLIEVEESGTRLNEQELIATCIMLLFAGHETTVNLIGNGLLALLRHPAELNRLAQQPEQMSRAVEELLRYDRPVSAVFRVAQESVEIGGRTIGPGQDVMGALVAANRDPARFTEPDHLDIGRDEGQALAFGQGIHYCLGAPLARLEASIAFKTLLRRMPAIRVGPEPLVWRKSFVFRGPATLSVSWC
jgi:cytochrome P450